MERDAYTVLGVEAGPNASEPEIRKAYRKRALSCHPDKVNDPKLKAGAEAEFDRVKKAYELLSDPEARRALDALLKAESARRERDAGQDAKRRKMREDLEKREKQAATEHNEVEQAKMRLQAELERLRKQNATKRKQANSAEHEASAADRPAGPADPQLAKTLKVTWVRACGNYTVEQLKAAFSDFGVIEDVVLRDGKKKKGVALVVFETPEAAELAADMPCGDFSNPLDVYRLGTGHETVMNHPQTPATTSTPAEPEQAGAFGAGSQSSTQVPLHVYLH